MDHYTYVIAGDGDMMEGVSSEAASFAGHQQLGKLIVLYDDNDISIDGSTDLAFTEDVPARFEAYHWHVQRVADGNDVEAIDAAITAAKAETTRPSFIAVRTHIGYGSPHKQDTAKAHGEALGADEVKLTKENLGWPLEPAFLVPDDVKAFFEESGARGAAAHAAWSDRHQAWRAADEARARTWDDAWSRTLPQGWDADLPVFTTDDKLATRAASGKVIEALVSHLPTLIGGSADLTPSNNTRFTGADDQQAASPAGRYIRFGVREHAMASMANGLVVHGGLRAYVATFFVFTDYMRAGMRMAAIMRQPVIHVLTHDSVGLGEDGPTHQPIEHLAILRATPELGGTAPGRRQRDGGGLEDRPAAPGRTDRPAAVASGSAHPGPAAVRAGRGHGTRRLRAGRVRRGGAPDLILLASGSEVHLCVEAYERLAAEGVAVRVVSMPSWELFEQQDQAYRDERAAARLPQAPRRGSRRALRLGALGGLARRRSGYRPIRRLRARHDRAGEVGLHRRERVRASSQSARGRRLDPHARHREPHRPTA